MVTVSELRGLSTGPRFHFLSADTVSLCVYLLTQRYALIEDTDEGHALIDHALYEVTSNMVGTILWLVVDTPPVGMLLCDGATYDAGDYPELHAVISANLKTATTLTVPNLMGRTVRGGYLPGHQAGSDSITTGATTIPIGELATTSVAPAFETIDTPNAYTELLPCLIAR